MMLEMRYPAIIRQDPEGKDFVVTFPDLKGSLTGGATLEEAIDEAADCLASWLAFAIIEKKPIPGPSALKARQFTIPVPLWIAPKVAVYSAMMEQKVSNTELARRLGKNETVVRRMLDPDHATNPKTMEAALRALGRTMYIVSAEAA